jgi:hypothetical protein
MPLGGIRFSVPQGLVGQKVCPWRIEADVVPEDIDRFIDRGRRSLEERIGVPAEEGQRAAVEDQFQVGYRSFARGVELVGPLHLNLTRAGELKLLPVVGHDLRLHIVIHGKAFERTKILRHRAKNLGGVWLDFSLCEGPLDRQGSQEQGDENSSFADTASHCSLHMTSDAKVGAFCFSAGGNLL